MRSGRILKNRAYLGLVRVSRWRSDKDEWIEGNDPALVDHETWDTCARIRARNRRRNGTTWTRRSYPLTPILRCGSCGGPMHGEASVKGTREDLYYACWDSRRTRSAARPGTVICTTRRIPPHSLEEAIRRELNRVALPAEMQDTVRDDGVDTLTNAPDPRAAAEAGLRRLADQLDRARRLYEFGEYDWDTFVAKRTEIMAEQEQLREQMAVHESHVDLEWCRQYVVGLLDTWEGADADQRTRLLASIFDLIEGATDPEVGLRLVGVPNRGWRPFFEYVVAQLHTWSCSNLSEVRGRVATLSRTACDVLAS